MDGDKKIRNVHECRDARDTREARSEPRRKSVDKKLTLDMDFNMASISDFNRTLDRLDGLEKPETRSRFDRRSSISDLPKEKAPPVPPLPLWTKMASLPTSAVHTSFRRSVSSASVSTPSPKSRRSSVSRPASLETNPADEEMRAFYDRLSTKRATEGLEPIALPPVPDIPSQPLRHADVISRLTPFEQREILDYKTIYFLGHRPLDKFDDDRADYIIRPGDQIAYRYEMTHILGKGSFGQVVQCKDHKSGEYVAVKLVRNKTRFHTQAKVEVKILKDLNDWLAENVIRMLDTFVFRGHLCIVTDLLSINLYELIKFNSFQGFSTTLVRRIASQMLRTLVLFRQKRVIHSDLKPENILLCHPQKSNVSIIDMGSSCFENEKIYTYIQSRFYRSPEVILGLPYSMPIDVWSMGCILAEMFTGYPIFPGEDELEQLACIIEVLGLPDQSLVNKSTRKHVFFDAAGTWRPVVNSKGRRRKPNGKTIASVLKTEDATFIDFIEQCLAWDPDKRIKPSTALRHPFIQGGGFTRSEGVTECVSPHTRYMSIGAPTPQRASWNRAYR